MFLENTETGKYCGGISWVICVLTGFCCIGFCPVDKVSAQMTGEKMLA